MPSKIISGTLTVPSTEASAGGFYTDLHLKLFQISGSTKKVAQTSTVSANRTYKGHIRNNA